MLQGIAILCMLGLHLFNRIDISNYYNVSLYVNFLGVTTPLLTLISYSFDICVPIYLFCSGYGLFKNYKKDRDKYKFKNIERVLHLIYRFWIIMIITCIIGYFMGMEEIYPGNFINFIFNALLLKSSYVGSFWFIQTYVLLVIFSKYIFQTLERYNYWKIIIISFFLYVLAFVIEKKILNLTMIEPLYLFINATMLLLRSQFSFVIGGMFAYYSFINKAIVKLFSNKIIFISILTAIILIRGIFLKSMVFAPFSAILFIILFCCYSCNKIIFLENTLLYFGKHSTNMWLTHMQYYGIFATSFVFISKNIFVIFLTLILLSLLSSYFIEYIYDAIDYVICRKYKKNI
ncbi:acyltransferase family protein [Thomasclavelia sp.]